MKNVRLLATEHGSDRLLEITVTFRHAAGLGRLQHCRRKLVKRMGRREWLGVLHVGKKSGRLDLHFCVVAADGIALKEEQALWRRHARACGFGRIECEPVRCDARYAKYLVTGVERSRAAFPKGTRCFFSSRSAQRCTTKFSWLREGQWFRAYLARRAAELGIDDEAGFRTRLGPCWNQRLWFEYRAEVDADGAAYQHRQRARNRPLGVPFLRPVADGTGSVLIVTLAGDDTGKIMRSALISPHPTDTELQVTAGHNSASSTGNDDPF